MKVAHAQQMQSNTFHTRTVSTMSECESRNWRCGTKFGHPLTLNHLLPRNRIHPHHPRPRPASPSASYPALSPVARGP